ncbi:hypothetical protein CHUAL_012076 [Chamberlinius hualienensis]
MLTLLTIVLRNTSLKNKEKLKIRGIYRLVASNKHKLTSAASTLQIQQQRTLSTTMAVNQSHNNFIFRQLFDRESCTYTYLLADGASKKAIIIDPVYELVDRDVQIVKELNLNLIYAANTHVHADHVTGSGLLKKRLPECQSLISSVTNAKADVYVDHGDKINVGDIEIEVRSTPGHTNGCLTYVCHREAMAFTGDALLVRGCGRTDFQQGDASKLYDSIHSQIFTLPELTKLYPAHDYKGFTVTTVAEEKKFNPRLTKPKQDFVELMKNLNLAYPKQIDVAVPSNMVCGEQELVEEIRQKQKKGEYK